MTFQDYLLHMFCLIDDQINDLGRLRRHGPPPTLSDSEVITMELAGEFLGIDTDKGIYDFFRRYHAREFPALPHVHRTAFARQAANLWRVKQLLHERLLARIPLHEDPLWLIDSFPLHVCKFARAKGSKLFKGLGAAFGYDHLIRNTFFGFRIHLRCADAGPVGQVVLTPADVSDLAAAGELAPPEGGMGIGDRNYWGPDQQAELAKRGFALLAPHRNRSRDPDPRRSRLLTRFRRTIETVIGQLAERFNCKRTWARDLWHLCSRITRKLLSHTIAVLLNIRAGNPPLQLAMLIDG